MYKGLRNIWWLIWLTPSLLKKGYSKFCFFFSIYFRYYGELQWQHWCYCWLCDGRISLSGSSSGRDFAIQKISAQLNWIKRRDWWVYDNFFYKSGQIIYIITSYLCLQLMFLIWSTMYFLKWISFEIKYLLCYSSKSSCHPKSYLVTSKNG